jgi:branched-chain amino acid transport system permease protein
MNKGLTVKDLVTTGIFTALLFVFVLVGGGIEIWFAYALALIFLLVRPQGLFGEKIIDRV